MSTDLTDFYTKQRNETPAEHKERIRKHEAEKFAQRKKMMEENKSTFLAYDEQMLKQQIVDMTNDVSDRFYDENGNRIRAMNDDEREIYEMRFSHLREMSKVIFNNILAGSFPDPKEIKCIMKFHKLIAEGKMTKYAASAAYSEYRITQLINKGKNENGGNGEGNSGDGVTKNKNFDNAWDIMRTKNAFADESIYD
jgi:hypothetical protein